MWALQGMGCSASSHCCWQAARPALLSCCEPSLARALLANWQNIATGFQPRGSCSVFGNASCKSYFGATSRSLKSCGKPQSSGAFSLSAACPSLFFFEQRLLRRQGCGWFPNQLRLHMCRLFFVALHKGLGPTSLRRSCKSSGELHPGCVPLLP